MTIFCEKLDDQKMLKDYEKTPELGLENAKFGYSFSLFLIDLQRWE